MCLACLEYTKGNLRLSEFKSALREFVQQGDTKEHAEQLQTLLYDHKGSEQDLKDQIAKLNPDKSS